MRIGLHTLGIGSGADPAVITAVARTAEECGFSTLWAGEHVVMVDRAGSRYPYADDGRIAVPSNADWLDPLILFGYAAAVTTRIRLATGVLLLAEHNPVITAKSAASVDVLSGGRFSLGVGIGWSAEEFTSLGVPFEGRGRRVEEYVEAMRTLWRDDVSTHEGPLVAFEAVRCYPKPLRRAVPVIFGGNGNRALRRVAEHGDGWYGFNVSLDALADRLEVLAAACDDVGRSVGALHKAVALVGAGPDDLPAVDTLGVDEVVLVDAPPDDPDEAVVWVRQLARDWNVRTITG